MINNRVKLFCLTAESPEEIDMRSDRAEGESRRADETEAEYSGVSYESAGSVQSYGTTEGYES